MTMRLETERLVLSVAGRGDYILMRDLMADAEVHRYLGPRADDPTTDMFSRALRAAGSWQLYGYGIFMVREKSTGDFVGQAGMFQTMRGFGKGLDDVPEAAWIFARPYWGRGYAVEAMTAAIDWFDGEFAGIAEVRSRIACMIERDNIASARLAERLGFARYDEHALPDGAIVDLFERFRPVSGSQA